MAILTEEVGSAQGFKKEIEESAMEMMIDLAQRYQYSYPHKSAIRELVSNSLDAIRERDIALGIISGKLKVEDYYLQREGDLYKDSNFDQSYYDPKWLWDQSRPHTTKELWGYESGKVYITYEDGGETGKDHLLIEDFGVGLGGRRLERYFHMGFSTKRNSRHAIGKYGIGAKAALAASSYYTMTTRYNGREYSFNIYMHNIQSIVPQLNTNTGKNNGLHIFGNGAKIWYRETIMPNGTTIQIEAKKHHKQLYLDAVKSQLLYFPNIELRIRNQQGGLDVIPHAAEILYEDDLIVLSNNTQFSKPHILIDKINYGNLDFKEMELEDKHGNIGIKISAEDITVNPSRESVMWNEKTTETVVKAFHEVVGIAERIIAKQLKVEDFIDWIRACGQISHSYSNGSVLERLSKVVDLKGVKIPYVKDPTVIYGYRLFDGLNVRVNHIDEMREGSVVKFRITRIVCSPSSLEPGIPILLQRGRASFKRDKYLLKEVYPQGFISFQVPFQGEEPIISEGVLISAGVTLDQAKAVDTPLMKELMERYPTMKREKLVDYMEKVSGFIQASAEHQGWYEDIVVPEDFDDSEEVVDAEETVEAKTAKASRELLRREAGVIPIFTPRNAMSSYVGAGAGKHEAKLYEWQKLEMPVADIDTWSNEEVFYATEAKIGKDEDGADIIESELLHLAAAITRPERELISIINTNAYLDRYNTQKNPDTVENIKMVDAMLSYKVNSGDATRCHNFTGSPRVKLIKVAQDRRKFFLDFKPIQRFFLDIKGKTLTMSNALVRWNTARVINEGISKLAFLRNFGLFHNHYHTTYLNIQRYVDANYRELKDHTANNRYYALRDSSYEDLVRHCDKVMKFQLLVRDAGANTELIGQAAKELFNPQQEITDGLAVDIRFYDSYKELLEYAEPIYVLLNEVGKLITAEARIDAELEAEIRSYLASKNVVTN